VGGGEDGSVWEVRGTRTDEHGGRCFECEIVQLVDCTESNLDCLKRVVDVSILFLMSYHQPNPPNQLSGDSKPFLRG